jgi:hypothetical protein
MPEQDRLQLAGQSFASVADSLSARFSRELGRVLSVLERDLLGMVVGVREKNRTVLSRVGRLLTLRREIRKALETSGYQALVTRASLDVVERMAGVVSGSRIASAGAALGAVSPKRVQAVASLLREDLLGLGETLAHQVWRASVLAIYTGQKPAALVSALAKAIERSRAQAQTLFDTQTSIAGRQIVAAEEQAPDQVFLYVGPVDGVVRPFCLEQLGMVRSRPAIDALDNGQLPNVFLTGGGYNCRHSWMAVSDPDLVALADTGTRAPGFTERVAVAKAFSASRSTRKKAA